MYWNADVKNGILALLIVIFSLTALPCQAELADLDITLEQITEQSEADKVVGDLQQLLANAELTSEQKGLVYRTLAMQLFQSGEMQQAIDTAIEARQFAKQLEMAEMQAQFAKLAGIFNYYKGDYGQARDHYYQAIEHYLNAPEQIQLAHLYNNLGLVYDNMGESAKSLEIYLKAKTIYDEIGSEVDKIDIAFNISGLYLTLKRYEQALELLPTIIEARERLQLHDDAALAYSNLALAYKYSLQYDKAEQVGLKTLNYYIDKERHYDVVSQLNNLADLYTEMGNLQKALPYAEQCLQKSVEHEHLNAYSNCTFIMAQLQYLSGQYQTALAYADESMALAIEQQDDNQITLTESISSLIHAALGNNEVAFNNYQQAKIGFHNLANSEINEQISSFESEQLVQQVNELKQQQKIAELNHLKQQQRRNFITVLSVLVLLIVFLIYRKSRDKVYRKRLQRLVSERTQRLQTTTEELTQANKIKSQFLANMSHEIRTPLTAIIGQSESIIYGEVSKEKVVDEVSIIHSNSRHLLQLINDILDLSKIEANKLQLDSSATDICLICSDLLNIFTEQARQKQLTFSIDNHLPSPCVLDIDYLRFSQIIINLCSNALKFTHQGEVKVTISLNSDLLEVSVRDTGIGMSEQQIHGIFDSFSQADGSINRRFGGTGLGLFLSNQLAQLMSGHISVSSQLDSGSCFTFTMPATQLADEKQAGALDDVDDILATKLSGNILVAEDHLDNLRFITRMLTNMGLSVFPASNGLQVLEIEQQQDIDVILLDIQMPELDGLQVLAKLRDKGFDKPVIALTANAMSQDVKQYLQSGFDEHIKKPIDRAAFVRAVAKYFKQANVASTSSEQQTEVDNPTYQLLKNSDMDDLIDSFKQKLPEYKQQIADYSAAQNWSQLQFIVHQLAGAGAIFGYPVISEMAASLERELRQTDINQDKVVSDSSALLSQLERSISAP